MASVPVFNPAAPADAIEMTKQAFKLSAEIKLPMIVRTTTRVSHSRGIISYKNIQDENRSPRFERMPEHINIPARTAAAHTRLLDKLKHKSVLELLSMNSKIILNGSKAKLGIISSGVATSYLNEILYQNNISEKVNLLDLGMIHPFPEKEVLSFLKNDFQKILVLEELDPFVENAVRTLAQKNKIENEIIGKGFSGLTTTGEFSIDIITRTLGDFLQVTLNNRKNIPIENSESFLQSLPPRLPTLCAGCPHRATFYLLKLAIPREQSELILCGDIGCFGLGALPPLKMIDTINHMGMSISMAQGIYESFNSSQSSKKVVALVGDGTFFHSGLSSLINAVYTRANILVVIFDNRTIGMTGHQSHPGASQHLPKYQEIDIPPLLKGLGIEVVEIIIPFNLRDGFEKLNKAMAHKGVSVVIAKGPCIFLPDFKEKIDERMKIVVDENLCNACANHENISLACSRCYSPKNNLSRAKAKLFAEVSIPGEEQLCPANICNHGFFNSILEGDYKSAVEIVRDKMLFAQTCGDICHRPCELFSTREKVVPIKALKKLVSFMDENFYDFSLPISRVKNAVNKNKSVAIIGAGPAGLSAAYDLVQAGYDVTVFEKEKKAGGMITYAIPDFRMDKAGFDFEAMQLKEMGVTFHFNSSLGKDFTIEKLSGEFDSVILAIGLSKSKTLDVIENNIPVEKRTDALSFLKSFYLKENKIKNGANILVIGGGNSAIDAARAAKKLNSKNKIIVSCIETENTMPAFAEEVKPAAEEGIDIIHDSYIESISAVKEGKFNIVLHSFSNKKHLQNLKFDYFITAIGQTTEPLIIEILPKDENTRVRSTNGFTGYKNVFVAGDIKSGNNMSVIGAIASGKKAAVSVRQHLENYPFEYEGAKALEWLNENSTVHVRQVNTVTTNNLREEIEQFNLYQACMKCNHCIDNFGCPAMIKINGKVEIDESRCTLCGLCIDVCPNNAIRWEQ
ncbi:MAG TPA: FAD-dependent oxidoreductase [Bacteroidia bacterium]|nr:FAD-dependent oxidoreductase [Bacteroidia bacterium]